MYSVGGPKSGLLARETDRLKIGLRGTRSGKPGKGGASFLLAFLVLAGCFFTMIAIVPVSVRAATLYVGGTGPGNLTTIQAAVDSASPGDTVFVYNGTYHEQVTIPKMLSLVGEGRNVTIIDGDSIGDVVYVTANWVNITGFTVTNGSSLQYSAGIELYWVSNCRVENSNVSGNGQTGIYLDNSHNNTIADSTFHLNTYHGIYMNSSDNNTVLDSEFSRNGYGVYLNSSGNNTVAVNGASDNLFGIVISGQSSGNRVADNNVSSNVNDGIRVEGPNSRNVIENNTAIGNEYGVDVRISDRGLIANNTVTNNTYGIYLWFATYGLVENNTLLNNTRGLSLVYSSNCTVDGNTVLDGVGEGILLQFSQDNTVMNNNASRNFQGIGVSSSDRNNISHNHVIANQEGIFSFDSHGNVISNNTLIANYNGIAVFNSDGGTIADNEIHPGKTDGIGIRLVDSIGETIVRNTMTDNGVFISGGNVSNWNTHTIESSNTVNGRPVYYWRNVIGGTVPSGAAQVLLGNCSRVVVEDENVSNVFAGLEFGFTSNVTVMNSTVSDNYYGIFMIYSQDNTVIDSNVSFNGYGIEVRSSERIEIKNITASGNVPMAIDIFGSNSSTISGNTILPSPNAAGIYVDTSNDNIVVDNVVSANRIGINLFSADNNAILRNVAKNGWCGIRILVSRGNTVFENVISDNENGTLLWQSDGNAISHNNFTNNTVQASDNAANVWNGSYPSGGNYWSDYAGIDTMHGPNQDLPGADGIGDTPQPISGGSNQDMYPLMGPFPPPPRAPPTPPMTLQAVAGNAQVTLTWAAPDWDGLSPVTNYTVFRGTVSGGETPLITLGDVLSHLDTGLTNGQTYYYKVAAVNAAGEGGRSNEASARPATLPGQPIGLTAVPADRQVSLAWSAPASNGGSPITNYAIYRGTTSGGETLLLTVGNILSHVDPGLTNGVTYYYTVAAINSVGQGPNSTETSATPLAVPTEPLNLQATSGNRQVTLTWSAPLSDGGNPIINYTVYRGLTPGGESYLIKIGNVLTYDDTGLINGRTYYYQVSATNGVGEGPRSAEVGGIPGSTPSAPIGLAASPGNRQAILTWSPPADNGGLAITSYSIYRGNFSGGETLLITIGNVLTYTDTGLANGQTYYYKVSAWNAMGEGAKSNEASTTPAVPPSEPSDLIANGGIGQVSLQWLPPIDNGGSPVTGYRVYKGTSPGGETLLVTLGNVQTYLDGGLNKGTAYYYQVTALNAVGEGRRSVERSATTAAEPAAPRNPWAVAGNGQVRLSWSVPSLDGGAPITNYRIYKGTSPSGEIFFLELGNVLTYTDTGLTNGQAYYYLVSAVNVIGEGIASGEVSATPTAGPSPPSAPQNLQAFAGNKQVTLTWVAPASDGGAPITSFRIYAGPASSDKSMVAETGNQLSFVDRGLTNGEMRFYEIAAVNAAGDGARSNEASATPRTVPGQPVGLTAVAGNGRVTLSWTAPAEDGGSAVTGYKVHRGIFSGQLTLLTTLGNVLTYLDTGLTNSQVYYYMASAVSAVGEGPGSPVVSATPWNRPPTCLIDTPSYRSSISGTVTVSGTASDQDGTVVRVEVRVDDGTWQVVSGTTSWSYSWDTGGVSDGQHTIYARSFDGDGYSGLAQTTVTVANAPPQGGNSACMIGLAILILLALVVFYFLKVRPKRREKEEKEKPPAK